MSKKHGIHAGMPFLVNHDSKNIFGKVTTVKETAYGLEFEVKPIKDKIYISLDQVEEFVWAEDNDRPIGVIFSKNSTDLLEAFEEFKKTAKFRPSEIFDAISKKAKPDDSLMAKIFGAQSFIRDYPHPDSKDARAAIKEELNSVYGFGAFQEASLELHCEVCTKYFKPTKDLHYVVKSHTAMFMAPDVETFHDAYDCPRCGSQIIAKERASAAK